MFETVYNDVNTMWSHINDELTAIANGGNEEQMDEITARAHNVMNKYCYHFECSGAVPFDLLDQLAIEAMLAYAVDENENAKMRSTFLDKAEASIKAREREALERTIRRCRCSSAA